MYLEPQQLIDFDKVGLRWLSKEIKLWCNLSWFMCTGLTLNVDIWWQHCQHLVYLNKDHIDWSKALRYHPDYYPKLYDDVVIDVTNACKHPQMLPWWPYYRFGTAKMKLSGTWDYNSTQAHQLRLERQSGLNVISDPRIENKYYWPAFVNIEILEEYLKRL